jgi:hypothetical protein
MVRKKLEPCMIGAFIDVTKVRSRGQAVGLEKRYRGTGFGCNAICTGLRSRGGGEEKCKKKNDAHIGPRFQNQTSRSQQLSLVVAQLGNFATGN